jgi:hypothetical protein
MRMLSIGYGVGIRSQRRLCGDPPVVSTWLGLKTTSMGLPLTLKPKSSFLRLSPVHRADLEGRLWVESGRLRSEERSSYVTSVTRAPLFQRVAPRLSSAAVICDKSVSNTQDDRTKPDDQTHQSVGGGVRPVCHTSRGTRGYL